MANSERRTVLVVDDDPTVLAVVAGFSSAAGLEPVLAADGQTALALLRAGLEPDLVITDRHMPGLDGPELLAAIAVHRQVTTIMYSAGQRPARNGGADLWLSKANPTALVMSLREFANSRGSAEQKAA